VTEYLLQASYFEKEHGGAYLKNFIKQLEFYTGSYCWGGKGEQKLLEWVATGEEMR
jgi:hypothetical protein